MPIVPYDEINVRTAKPTDGTLVKVL